MPHEVSSDEEEIKVESDDEGTYYFTIVVFSLHAQSKLHEFFITLSSNYGHFVICLQKIRFIAEITNINHLFDNLYS